jgi:hypothetical protein
LRCTIFCSDKKIYETLAGYLTFHAIPKKGTKNLILAPDTTALYFGESVNQLKTVAPHSTFWTEIAGTLSSIRTRIVPEAERKALATNIPLDYSKSKVNRDEVSCSCDTYLRCGKNKLQMIV